MGEGGDTADWTRAPAVARTLTREVVDDVEPKAGPVVTVLPFVLLAILTVFTFVADGSWSKNSSFAGSPPAGCRACSRLPGRGVPACRAGAAQRAELEVLRLVAAGNTTRETAAGLFITEATVKSPLLNIYGKLGVGDRAAAMAEAFHLRLLKPKGH